MHTDPSARSDLNAASATVGWVCWICVCYLSDEFVKFVWSSWALKHLLLLFGQSVEKFSEYSLPTNYHRVSLSWWGGVVSEDLGSAGGVLLYI